MAMIDVDRSTLEVDSIPRSVVLVWELMASPHQLHLSNESGEYSRWLCHDENTRAWRKLSGSSEIRIAILVPTTPSFTVWTYSSYGCGGRCKPNIVWAPTGALEKTSRATTLHLAHKHQWWPDLVWHGAAEGKRCSSESTFLENAGFT